MHAQQPTTQPEARLIASAAEGDLQAFNELVLKHQNLVYNLARAILGDRDAAEDAAQETFISAFEHIRGFRGGSFRGWLLRIATNTCYDLLRHLRRRPSMPLFPDDQGESESAAWLADPQPAPDAQVERDELARALYRRMDELPGPYRSAITLIDLHGLDYAEAAQALGIPVGTVKSRLARARYHMREAISQEFDYRRGSPAVNTLAAA